MVVAGQAGGENTVENTEFRSQNSEGKTILNVECQMLNVEMVISMLSHGV
jgi:hypothetical protein